MAVAGAGLLSMEKRCPEDREPLPPSLHLVNSYPPLRTSLKAPDHCLSGCFWSTGDSSVTGDYLIVSSTCSSPGTGISIQHIPSPNPHSPSVSPGLGGAGV